MNRFIWPVALCAAASMAACASAPAADPLPQVSPVAVGLQQLDKDMSQTFVTCQPCAQPTPKTLWTPPPAVPPAQPAALPPAPASPIGHAAPAHEKETLLTTTVHFAANSASLDSVAEARLHTFCHGEMQLDGLTVTGHTDSSGTPERNHEMARRRAAATSRFLRNCAEQQGKSVRIDERVEGACCYVAPNDTAEGRAKNRRVDVEQTTETAPPPSAAQPSTHREPQK